MDDSKRKTSKPDRKKNDSLIRRNAKKKKTKKKSNLKAINGASTSDHLFSQFRRPGVGKPRPKGKGVDGMFFKGLRSEYITRETLNEANEARLKEDINKIIDIGGVFRYRRENQRPNNNPKPNNSPVLYKKTRNDKREGNDLEECRLSPISFVSPSREENTGLELPMKHKKLDLEREFEKFSSKYEETVGPAVLLKLPDDGILEEALRALRKKRNKTTKQELFPADDVCLKEFTFLTKNNDNTKESFMEKCFIPKIPIGGTENPLIMSDVQSETFAHQSIIPFFHDDVENLNLLEFHEDFEKTAKDLSLQTPPMHFYRRNMF